MREICEACQDLTKAGFCPSLFLEVVKSPKDERVALRVVHIAHKGEDLEDELLVKNVHEFERCQQDPEVSLRGQDLAQSSSGVCQGLHTSHKVVQCLAVVIRSVEKKKRENLFFNVIAAQETERSELGGLGFHLFDPVN